MKLSQVILWASIIVPWLTLFFLKKDEIRQYLPVAFLGMVITFVLLDMGLKFNWWVTRETIYPLYNVQTHILGPFPVGTIWIFKYTYGRFWRYLAVNAAVDLFYCFFIAGRIGGQYVRTNPIEFFLMIIFISFLLYGYQIWQEGKPIRLETLSPQPAALKRYFKEDEK